MTNLAIDFPTERIIAFCRRWKVVELGLFGSALRGDMRPDSDVDLLVTFAADAKWKFGDLVQMAEELEAMLGRRIDLVERRLVERSDNYIRRRHILSTVQPVYVA